MAPATSPAAPRALAPVAAFMAGIAAAPRIPMTAITITSSMSVKPLDLAAAARISGVDDVRVLAVPAGLAVGAVALHVEGVGVDLAGVEVDVVVLPGVLGVLALAGGHHRRQPLLGGRIAPPL